VTDILANADLRVIVHCIAASMKLQYNPALSFAVGIE